MKLKLWGDRIEMPMPRWNRFPKRYMWIALLFVLSLSAFLFIWKKAAFVPPVVSAGISSVQKIGADEIEMIWAVENKSDKPITFEVNEIAKIRWNSGTISYQTPHMILEAGERKEMPIVVHNVDMEKSNTIEITASCKEGTSVTIKKTIYP